MSVSTEVPGVRPYKLGIVGLLVGIILILGGLQFLLQHAALRARLVVLRSGDAVLLDHAGPAGRP